MELVIYNKNNYKITRIVDSYNDTTPILEKDEVLAGFRIPSVTYPDIRAYNKHDGSCKPIEQLVSEGIIKLESNQIIKNKEIHTLNPNIEEDKILLIRRGLLELEPNYDIITDSDGIERIVKLNKSEEN